MAAAGFITGSIGGVVLINLAVRRGWIASDDAEKLRKRTLFSGFLPKGQTREGSRLTSEGESIDTLSYHVALIMVAYLVSWLMLSAIELLLNLLGPFGAEIASTLWGVNFIFSMFAASLLRLVIRRTGIDYTIDNGTLNRINGLSVDLTVTACLAGISLTALAAYYVPVIILILVGIVITCLILPWYSSRIYSDHAFFRMLVLFGTATGTLPTGLSLLRVVDPDFETPAAQDYAYASGLVFVFVFPLILFVNLPAYSYSQNNPVLFYAMLALTAPTGKPVGFWWIGLHHVRTPFSGFGTRAAAQPGLPPRAPELPAKHPAGHISDRLLPFGMERQSAPPYYIHLPSDS